MGIQGLVVEFEEEELWWREPVEEQAGDEIDGSWVRLLVGQDWEVVELRVVEPVVGIHLMVQVEVGNWVDRILVAVQILRIWETQPVDQVVGSWLD